MLRKRSRKNKEIKKHDKSYVKKPIEIPELKKFSYKILYKNGEKRAGILETLNMNGVVETFLKNQYSYGDLDNKKLIYFNTHEILEFEAEELSNK